MRRGGKVGKHVIVVFLHDRLVLHIGRAGESASRAAMTIDLCVTMALIAAFFLRTSVCFFALKVFAKVPRMFLGEDPHALSSRAEQKEGVGRETSQDP